MPESGMTPKILRRVLDGLDWRRRETVTLDLPAHITYFDDTDKETGRDNTQVFSIQFERIDEHRFRLTGVVLDASAIAIGVAFANNSGDIVPGHKIKLTTVPSRKIL